ncbi:MAG: NF038122 family metalloprotease [Verrucomicrobiota bacterium]
MIPTIKKLVPILMVAFSFCLSAQALVINATYDTSVTSSPQAAQIENAYNWVIQTYENQFTNDITVNITVYWGGSADLGQVGLGESETFAVGANDYSQVVGALYAAQSSAYDTEAVNSLPASDPTGGGGQWYVPQAEAKALNLTSLGVDPNGTSEDGEVGFGTNGISYTFDPTNRAVPGEYDFIGVAEHETTEVMGRTNFGLDQNGNYVPYDLFRFTGSGTRSFDYNASDAYFSIDNGVTVLKDFNDGGANGGDVQDWATSTPADSYDAFISAGQKGALSTADFIAMNILGYSSPGISSAHVVGTRLANGSFQLSFTNLAATSFSVLSSTNITAPLSEWTVLGTAVEYPVGEYNFTDTQAGTKRFYCIRSP